MERLEPSAGSGGDLDGLQQLPWEQQDADLVSSLMASSQLSTGGLGLTELPTRVAGLAVVWAIPGADGAGLT